ncbi:MAG: WD40/YVTN/BNR-like repeat-containing protein [Jatrophihabitans sp.]|uniref:WD40/YVTN/BNR-like repeat-containing protein n=1 Tax=Jatrophihabitans sp. TaxID=1932789 RepID=UPI003F80E61F
MSTDEERTLRASLERQAQRAPRPEPVVDRILTAVTQPARPSSRSWRTWALPVLAAAAVAGVVVGVSLTGSSSPRANPNDPAVSRSVAPSPSVSSSSTAPSPAPSTTSSATSAAPPPDTSTLHHFRAVDLSFVGTADGWALGLADCVQGTGRCTAMERTTDGGATWHSITGPPANIEAPLGSGLPDCVQPCVGSVRFATASVGYAFGRSALFLTTDGGTTWRQQPGGADALETADGNVIRIVSDGTGCPGPCKVRAELAPVGGSTWTTVPIAKGDLDVASLAFTRTFSDAYLLAMRNPAGGAQDATSTLYGTHDDGRTWRSYGEPCTSLGAGTEYDSTAIATTADGTLVVGCSGRGFAKDVLIELRSGAGAFSTPIGGNIGSTITLVAGATADHVLAQGDFLVAETAGVQRPVVFGADPHSPQPAITWLGFENTTTGHALSGGGARVWTTTDAGTTWSPFDFPA